MGTRRSAVEEAENAEGAAVDDMGVDHLATLKCESLKEEVSKHFSNRRLRQNLEHILFSAVQAGP